MSATVGVVGQAGDVLVRSAIIRQLRDLDVDLRVGSVEEVLSGSNGISAVVLTLDPPDVADAVAAEQSARRLVMLSSASAPFERGAPVDQQWFLPAEQIVERSGREWTIVRPVGFMLLADFASRPPRPRDTVQRVLGRPARSFADWAVEHADDFRWADDPA